MKCAHLLSLTLASTLLATTGCDKDKAGQAKPDETPPPAAPAATANVIPSTADPNEVLASVNDTKLQRKDLTGTVDSLIKSQNIPADQQAEARAYFEQSVTQSFIMKTLLIDEAKKQGLTVTDEDRKKQTERLEEMLKRQNKTIDQYFKESPLGEEKARAEFDDGVIIDKLVTVKVLDPIKVDKADVDKVIEDIKKQNAEIEEKNKNLDSSKAAAKAKAEDLKKQLDNGADFAELATANSDCPSKQRGGDLGEFTRGQMVKPFEDAAFKQEIGIVGNIVETPFGFHLIKVTGKSPATEAQGDTPAKPETVTASHILVKTEQVQQPRPIPTVEEVENQLKQGKSREAIQAYIEGLKSAAKIETVFKDMQF